MNGDAEPQLTTETTKTVDTPNEFYRKMEMIIDLLDTCENQYTDTEYKDRRVYDRVDLLQRDCSEGVKEDLQLVKNKIREARLLMRDILDYLLRYN